MSAIDCSESEKYNKLLKNIPKDVRDAIKQQQEGMQKKSKLPVSATQAIYKLIRLGIKCECY